MWFNGELIGDFMVFLMGFHSDFIGFNGDWMEIEYNVRPPFDSFGGFITPITMVYGTYNYTGANLNQLITGGATW